MLAGLLPSCLCWAASCTGSDAICNHRQHSSSYASTSANLTDSPMPLIHHQPNRRPTMLSLLSLSSWQHVMLTPQRSGSSWQRCRCSWQRQPLHGCSMRAA